VHGEGLTVGTPFLSDDWLDEVERLRSSTEGLLVPPGMGGVNVNLRIEDDPHGDGSYHLEGAPGGLAIRRGLVDGAPATVSMPYDLARAMFVDQDQAAVMTGFTGGKLRVDGDMTRLMALTQGLMSVDAKRSAFEAEMRALTA
jgi:hypothetical protein